MSGRPRNSRPSTDRRQASQHLSEVSSMYDDASRRSDIPAFQATAYPMSPNIGSSYRSSYGSQHSPYLHPSPPTYTSPGIPSTAGPAYLAQTPFPFPTYGRSGGSSGYIPAASSALKSSDVLQRSSSLCGDNTYSPRRSNPVASSSGGFLPAPVAYAERPRPGGSELALSSHYSPRVRELARETLHHPNLSFPINDKEGVSLKKSETRTRGPCQLYRSNEMCGTETDDYMTLYAINEGGHAAKSRSLATCRPVSD